MISSWHHCTLIPLFLPLGEVKDLNKSTLTFIQGRLNEESFEESKLQLIDSSALVRGQSIPWCARVNVIVNIGNITSLSPAFLLIGSV